MAKISPGKTSQAQSNSAANPSESNPEDACLDESCAKCPQVTNLMYKLGLTLDEFLHNVIYGNHRACDVSAFKKAQRDLRNSPLLLDILDSLHTVPRTESKGRQTSGAVLPLESWANATMDRIYRKELLEFAESMHCNIDELVDDDSLKSMTFESIYDAAKASCPRLLETLSDITRGTRQEAARQMDKDSKFVSTLMVGLIRAIT
jgi:hypothetical protein